MVSSASIKQYLKINPKLINVKVVCFAYTAGAVSLLAFLTIHMNWLGLTEGQIGIIYGAIPAMNIFGPPIFGPMADKFQIHRQLLVLLILVTTVANNCLQLAPRYLTEPFLPDFLISFDENSNPTLIASLSEKDINSSSVTNWDQYDCSRMPTNFTIQLRNCETSSDLVAIDDTIASAIAQNCTFQTSFFRLEPEQNIVIKSSNVTMLIAKPLFQLKVHELVPTDLKPSCELPRDLTGLKCSVKLVSTGTNLTNHTENEAIQSKFCLKMKGSSLKTFAIYFAIRIVAQVSINTCFILLDAILLALIKEHNGDYGMQRLWQMIGIAVSVPVTGVACDKFSAHLGYQTYAPAFIIFAITMAIAAVIVFFMRVPDEIKADSIIKNLGILAKYPAIWFFGLAALFLGCQWGNLEAFIFVFFKTLNASSTEMGLTITVGQLSGLPLIFMSKAIFHYTGEIVIIIAAFYIYVVRYFGYAYVTQMRWVYFFEVMEGWTTSFMWVAAVTYSARITPPGMFATVQTIIGALHFGFGKGLGSFIGGVLWDNFGARTSYKILGISCLVGGVIYSLLHLCWLRKLEFKPIKSNISKPSLERNLQNNSNPNEFSGLKTAKKLSPRSSFSHSFNPAVSNDTIESSNQDYSFSPISNNFFDEHLGLTQDSILMTPLNQVSAPKKSVASVYQDAYEDFEEIVEQARRRSLYLSSYDIA